MLSVASFLSLAWNGLAAEAPRLSSLVPEESPLPRLRFPERSVDKKIRLSSPCRLSAPP